LGTRIAATTGDFVAGSAYPEGMGWMKRQKSDWPCKRSFGQAPTEEMRTDMVAVVRPTIPVEGRDKQGEDIGKRISRENIGIYIFVATYKWRKKTGALGLNRK
jgi:hypothetical protein